MDTLLQDIRYALKGFVRQPGFTAAAIGALALGIGANTLIFSVINAVLLHPLALTNWHQPGRVVMLWEKNPSLSLMFADHLGVRLHNFRLWKEQSRSFSDLAAFNDATATLTGEGSAGGRPEQLELGYTTSNLFPLMGIHVRLGRGFTSDEMQAGKGQVAVLTDEIYRSRFRRDPRILGTTILLDGKRYAIVGVLPPASAIPPIFGGQEQRNPKIWVPIDLHPPKHEDESFSALVFGRLRPGVSFEQASAEMAVIGKRLARTDADEVGFSPNVTSILDEASDKNIRQALTMLQIAVFFVLLIACANVGNLLLTRAVARDKEIAVRSALGASSFRIVRQTMTESMLLSLAAGVVGILLAFAGLRVFSAFAPTDIPSLHQLRIDGLVLLFTMCVAVIAALLFGIAPAYHSLKKNINEILNRSARSVAGTSNRLRSSLVVVEIALSLILIVGAGLMIRSLSSLMSADLGFDPDHLLVMRLALPQFRYAAPEQLASFNGRLLASVRDLSQIKSAALTTALPMKSVAQSSFEIPGRTAKKGSLFTTDWARVSDGYFETLDMKLLKGRAFTHAEATSENPAVAVVNQAFAREFFANEDPIGKVVSFSGENGKQSNYRIVGLVPNEHQLGPDNEQHSELYLPGDHLRDFMLVARTPGDPLRFASAMKQQVWNIDKDQAVAEVMTEQNALREWTAPRRFNMAVLLNFAGIALFLAAVGLYSVLAYSVTLRRREIGIRMAIGANPGDVARYIVRHGLILSVAGIAIGAGASLALTRFMAGLIYGVGPFDPVTFGFVTVLLILISVVASYVPARRASRIDPVEALRLE